MNSNPLASASAKQLRRALALRERIEALEQKLHAILGGATQPSPAPVPKAPGRKLKGGMSAAGRESVAAAMRARWRRAKMAGRSSL